MSDVLQKNIIVAGAPVAWFGKISAGAITEKYVCTNAQAQLKLPISAAEAAGGENQDITRSTGGIIRFSKFNKIFSGVDESDITPAGTSSTATGKGEITVVFKQTPEGTGLTTFTSFLKSLEAEKDSKFLIAIPTGMTYFGMNAGTPKPDGWAYMIGKRTSDIDITYDANAKELTATFAANSDSTVDAADFTGLTFPDIDYLEAGTTMKPLALISGDAADLIAGKVVIKSETYA